MKATTGTPMSREQRVEAIARVCYGANKALNDVHGEVTLAYELVQDSVCVGIEGALSGRTPEQSHQAWIDYKLADGWVYGEVKDADAKTHPCLMPYDRLPEFQRVKDDLFLGIVRVLAPTLDLA